LSEAPRAGQLCSSSLDIIFHIAVNFQCSLGCYSPSSFVVAKDATMRERERERERVAVELLGIHNTHNNNNNNDSLAPFFFSTTCMIQQAHEFSCLFFFLDLPLGFFGVLLGF
jgi:hypothetical protein